MDRNKGLLLLETITRPNTAGVSTSSRDKISSESETTFKRSKHEASSDTGNVILIE